MYPSIRYHAFDRYLSQIALSYGPSLCDGLLEVMPGIDVLNTDESQGSSLPLSVRKIAYNLIIYRTDISGMKKAKITDGTIS